MGAERYGGDPVGPDSAVGWPDAIDEILAGDLAVALGLPTPKGGVVLAGVAPIGLRDRAAGRVGFTTSVGFGRKLERIAADPRAALLYHTRQHGHTSRPGVVLLQGHAAVTTTLTDGQRDELKRMASQHLGQVVEGWFWDRWLSTYYRDRVLVWIRAKRILWWADGDIARAPMVLGAALPQGHPPSQIATADIATPRVRVAKVARSLRKPHRLLGFLQADGMPLIVPVDVEGTTDEGVLLRSASTLLPTGARRAGLLAHDFRPQLVGLSTATHTGWLRSHGRQYIWTPHTRHAFRAPANKTLLLLVNGAAARWGYRKALRNRRRHGTDRAHQR